MPANTSKYLDETRAQELINETKRRLALKVDKSSSPYIPGGSIVFASLPAASEATSGMVYNITNGFTTTADFVEGAGIKCTAGTDVAIVKIPNTNPAQYKYNIFSGNAEPEILTASELASMWKDPASLTLQYNNAEISDGDTINIGNGQATIDLQYDGSEINYSISPENDFDVQYQSVSLIDDPNTEKIVTLLIMGNVFQDPPEEYFGVLTITIPETATTRSITKTITIIAS